jgi:GDP-D-mannose dehydratase
LIGFIQFLSTRWEGNGINEVGKERETGIIRVRVNPEYFRPSEAVSVDKRANFCSVVNP